MATHLILSMLSVLSVLQILDDESEENKFYFLITALFHDISKIYSLTTNEKKKSISYPSHALLGAITMAKLWHVGLEEFISFDKWVNICETIKLHMCTYHHIDQDLDKRMNIHSMEINSCILKNLYYLSFGDSVGKISENICNRKQVLQQSIEFLKSYKETLFTEIIKNNGLNDGLLIIMCGDSGSGKSTTINEICINLLFNGISKDMIKVVSRDLIICNVVLDFLGENSVDYLPTGDERNRLQQIYRINKKFLTKNVNYIMKNNIGVFLKNKKIVIVDTLALIYNGCSKLMLPKYAKNVFRIYYHIHRNILLYQLDADRLGISLEEQVKINGIKSFLQNMPFTADLNNIALISESKDFIKNNFKPYMNFFKVWDNSKCIGNLAFEKVLKHISNHFIDNKNIINNKTIINKEITNIENLKNVNILTLVNLLYKEIGLDGIYSFFEERYFSVNVPRQAKNEYYNKRLLTICYKECNKCWDIWASECRNIQLVFDEFSNSWVIIKFLLKRGPEVFTNMHISNGLEETQDTAIDNTNHLSEEHQKIINVLKNNIPKKCYLDSKKDGCLIGLQIYPFGLKEGLFMKKFIEEECEQLHNIFLKTCEKLNLPYFIVLSSNATLLLGENMLAYTVSSILGGIYGIKEININSNPLEIFEPYIENFTNKIDEFIKLENFSDKEILCLSFEAICANRTDFWGGLHNELAIQYKNNSFNYLGLTRVNNSIGEYKYYPHFKTNKLFTSPYYWKTTTDKITGIMEVLDNVINGKQKPEEFLQLFPPNNNNLLDIENIDYEGFILFSELENSSKYLYSKIKTVSYYINHKFKEKNVKKILDIPFSTSEIFPLVGSVHTMYVNLEEKLIVFKKECREKLIEICACNLYDPKIYESFDEKIKESFNKKNFDIKSKMLINLSEYVLEMLFTIFIKQFPIIIVSSNNIKIFKKIIMDIQIWKNDDDKIKEFIFYEFFNI